jgi:hypothetical protein
LVSPMRVVGVGEDVFAFGDEFLWVLVVEACESW